MIQILTNLRTCFNLKFSLLLTRNVTTDKRNGSDIGMITNKVDSIMLTMNYIDHTWKIIKVIKKMIFLYESFLRKIQMIFEFAN